MFFSEDGIKKPKKNFNLIHLENSEMCILNIKAVMMIGLNMNEVIGKLYLCSRSLIFEPKELKLPLIKIKYSNNIILKLFKNIEKNKLKCFPISMIKQNMAIPSDSLYEEVSLLNKRQHNTNNNSDNIFKNDILEKNFIQKKNYKEKNTGSEMNSTPMIIKVDKFFIIHRNPISPYITEKNKDLIVFDIQNNTKQTMDKFFKYFHLIKSAEDETECLNKIIELVYVEEIEIFKNLKIKNNENINHLFRVKEITIKGIIYSLASITNNKIFTIYPVLNCPYEETKEYDLNEVKYFLKYRYNFKQNGIQIWFHNTKNSSLYVFEIEQIRNNFYNYLKDNCKKLQDSCMNIEYVKLMWINGQISNYNYLVYLNIMANRSYNDLSQYPIFPWILSEYTKKDLDLNDPENYRDLSKPVGALNKHKLFKYKDIYGDIVNSNAKNTKKKDIPYLYSTHYSTPGFVVYFLLRKIPEFVIKLQNGVFGPTDRIFRGIDSSWYSTVSLGSDFKELIPEFYSEEDFLINSERLELGVTPEGEIIDDATLPNWAEDFHDFLNKMRAALESDYVSSNLNNWIDLIFGYKQTGESAIQADNVFYPLTYEENVNWSKYKSSYEISAIETQISEFGQVPLKLFQNPHPQKKMRTYNMTKSIGSGKINLNEEDKSQLIKKLMIATNEIEKLNHELDKVKKENNRKENFQRENENINKKEYYGLTKLNESIDFIEKVNDIYNDSEFSIKFEDVNFLQSKKENPVVEINQKKKNLPENEDFKKCLQKMKEEAQSHQKKFIKKNN